MKITDDPKTWKRARGNQEMELVYQKWHWGIKPTKKVNWPDRDLPDVLIEIGRLWELHVRMPGGVVKVIEVDDAHKNDAYLAFDPRHDLQRLYILAPPAVRTAAYQLMFEPNPYPERTLASWAQTTKGKHQTGYPNVKARMVGALTDVVYRTHKKGDDDEVRGSSYIHALGEESKRLPGLAVDRTGRMWVVGGNYSAPTPGITD